MRLYVNQNFPSEVWRQRIYDGDIFLMTNMESGHQMGDFAETCIYETFGSEEPQTAHKSHSVEEFIEKASQLKSRFTNHKRCKELIRDFISELDENPQDYFFDVPRLRVITPYDYLHAGVAYQYPPHRDTWYGNPSCQIQTWMPVFSVEPDLTMPMYPSYFDQEIKNSSSDFDLKRWIEIERPGAATQTTTEKRKHPLPQEEIDPASEVLVAGRRGDILILSGRHLHGSKPNRGDTVRFSIDFRIYSEYDLRNAKGPHRLDDQSTNKAYGLKDVFRASDFSRCKPIEHID